ncbi:tetratricopeptide repeat protein [Okeania sp. SIO2B9]|uniref:tetratricopeptide repeat protein n=1 Tax=Okeania sp. SIO2B9 TaxID=2607782 RepID=UPI00142BB774|nr:tetratricopeptide repeat protein [Okeania sp. SIO2B9]NES88383.1 tetratricopeptide repeat protein [Okeania sp. SIO2B9]
MPKNQYLTNQKLLKETDIFLASYPRSGNTWIRLLLSDVLLQLQGFQTTTGGNIIPDAYKISINEWNNQINTKLKFRIIKTHEPLFFQQTLELENRVFYLFRKPADCLCSYYYYSLRYEKNKEHDKGIDKFCLDNLERWSSHVTTYMSCKEKSPERIMFVSYEKLSYNPVKVMNYIVELLGWENCQLICQKSVENQEFNKLKSLSKEEKTEKMGFWEDHGYQDFFRKGKVNSSQQELSPETLRVIEEKAMPIYKKATSFEPIFPFEFSGEIFEKQLQKQIEKRRENLDKYPKHFVAARDYYRLGKLEKAITSYRQAIKLNPNSAWSYHNLGKALTKLQKWDEAIPAYQEAIKLNPNSGSFYYNLAEAFMKQGNLDKAIANYSKAIEIKPSFSIGHNSLGEALAKQGKLVEAIGCFRKAVELNSNYFRAYGNLAELLAEKGKLEEAVSFWQEAIKINPSYQITNPKLREAVK